MRKLNRNIITVDMSKVTENTFDKGLKIYRDEIEPLIGFKNNKNIIEFTNTDEVSEEILKGILSEIKVLGVLLVAEKFDFTIVGNVDSDIGSKVLNILLEGKSLKDLDSNYNI